MGKSVTSKLTILVSTFRSFTVVDDLTHFTLREWTRMSLSPTSVEVERAKSQLKASLLLGLDGTTAVAEDVSRRLRLPNLLCLLFADWKNSFVLLLLLLFGATDWSSDGYHRQAIHSSGDRPFDRRHHRRGHSTMRKDLPVGQGHCHRRHRADRGSAGLQPYPSRHVEHDLLDAGVGESFRR